MVRFASAEVAQDVLENEQHGNHIQEDRNFLELAARNLDERVGDEAEADTIGDGVGKRHHGDRQEARYGNLNVLPVDVGRVAKHQHANDNERRRGRSAGDDASDGAEEERCKNEQDADDNTGQAGAAAFADACRAFNESGHSGSAEDCAANGRDGVCDERFIALGQVAVLIKHAGSLRGTDQRADSVEAIADRKGDDRRDQGEEAVCHEAVESFCEHLAEHGRERIEAMERDLIREGGHAKRNADDRGRNDADEERALHFVGHQHCGDDKADERYERGATCDSAKLNEAGRSRTDDANVEHADQSDEQADAGADRALQGRRNCRNNLGAERRNGNRKEDQAREHDDSKRVLPSIAHAHAYAEA